MKKKILAICVVAILVLTAITGATLAYLTDTDEAENVFTIGNVKIKQNEQLRDGTDFENVTGMMPLVTGVDVKDENGYPACPNYEDKIVTVTNTGKSNAYIRTFIAIPKYTYEGQPNTPAAYANVLHWNGYSYGDLAEKYPAATRIPGTDTDAVNNWWWGKEDQAAWPGNAEGWNTFDYTDEAGQEYTVYVVTNVAIVKPEETTAPNMIGVYLDSKVDFDGTNFTYDGKAITGFDGTVEILVATQAVQADGFANAWTALDAAFGAPAADNNPWAN